MADYRPLLTIALPVFDLTRAVARAFASLAHPKILWLMIWPMAVSLALWIGLAVLFWGDAWSWMSGALGYPDAAQPGASTWGNITGAALKWIFLLLLLVPLTLITATLIIGFAAMPVMVKHVGTRSYPRLEQRRGGTVAGSVWNSLWALVLLILLAGVSLPLWLLPPLWPLIPVLLFGYFNERVFRYDALADHADARELQQVIRDNRGKLFALGLSLGVLGYVPLAGLLVPVLGGLVFIHFCLSKLQQMRAVSP